MALREALKSRWFWYSILCVLCWGAWALLSKLGSRQIPPETMQFLFTVGTLPVCIASLIARRFKLEKSLKGISYAVANGILSGVGGLNRAHSQNKRPQKHFSGGHDLSVSHHRQRLVCKGWRTCADREL